MDDDCECEGWIYLPHDKLMELQRQKTELMRKLLENMPTSPAPKST